MHKKFCTLGESLFILIIFIFFSSGPLYAATVISIFAGAKASLPMAKQYNTDIYFEDISRAPL